MKAIVSTSLISFLILSILLGIFGLLFPFDDEFYSEPLLIYWRKQYCLRVYFVGFPFLFMYNILSTMFHIYPEESKSHWVFDILFCFEYIYGIFRMVAGLSIDCV